MGNGEQHLHVQERSRAVVDVHKRDEERVETRISHDGVKDKPNTTQLQESYTSQLTPLQRDDILNSALQLSVK